MQVKLVHVIYDVVAVLSNQFVVVVDLLLWWSSTKSVNNNTQPRTKWSEIQAKRETEIKSVPSQRGG